MAKIKRANMMCDIFACRRGMKVIPVALLAPKPLKEIELPIFKVGDVFGGKYEVSLALNHFDRPEFIFETQRGFVIVPLYGFFKEFEIGRLDDQAFLKESVVPKYRGEVVDALRDIHKRSSDEKDFAERMLNFFSERSIRVISTVEDPAAMVKFGKSLNECKRGYISYTLEFV